MQRHIHHEAIAVTITPITTPMMMGTLLGPESAGVVFPFEVADRVVDGMGWLVIVISVYGRPVVPDES